MAPKTLKHSGKNPNHDDKDATHIFGQNSRRTQEKETSNQEVKHLNGARNVTRVGFINATPFHNLEIFSKLKFTKIRELHYKRRWKIM